MAVWHAHPGSDGQHHGDALSEQGGRDQIQEPGHQSPGEYSLVSEVEDFSDGIFPRWSLLQSYVCVADGLLLGLL